MSNNIYERIRANPKFHALVTRRARLAWWLFAIVLALYYSLMSVVAFRPDLLNTPVGAGMVVTVGWPIGAAIIIVGWLLTGLYVWRANTEFAALSDSILEEAQR